MLIRNLLSCGAAAALLIAMPNTAAKAQYSHHGGALAAGIIGAAIGSAIIANGARAQPQYRNAPRRAARSRAPRVAKDSRQAKDPFAASAAPAGYARPVSAAR